MESVVLPCTTIPIEAKGFSQNTHKPHCKVTFKGSKEDSQLRKLCESGRLGEAIASLDSIEFCGLNERRRTLSYLIESCVQKRSLGLCYELHAGVKRLLKQESDQFLETKMVGMFAKCGSLDDAVQLFDEMTERDLYAWSAVIGAYSREKRWDEVVELFYSMMMDGNVVPDNFLFPKILQACGNCREVETTRLIHAMTIKLGMKEELRVNNSILAVYAKCGRLNSAQNFFRTMEVKDVVSWNSIITGYCQQGQMNEALKLFELMREEGLEPSAITWNIMISCCNQSGKCDMAVKMMNEMERCGIKPDVFTWTSMISGFAQNNKGLEALHLFAEMLLSGVEPNAVTLMSAISACSSLKDFRKGKEVHLLAVKVGVSDVVLVGNSLIDMYSKSGKLQTARKVFDLIYEKDVYTWNTMLAGYCQAGYCGIAHDLFKRMHESNLPPPNVVTWNVMITGYIQNGDVDQAMDLFQRMEDEGRVHWDTASWNALIVGFAHHGFKNKALSIFRQMQSFGFRTNSVTILSIIPACETLVAWKKLKEIHGCILRTNLESEVSVINSLVDAYTKSGNLKYAETVFDEASSKDVITWNSILAGYVAHGCHLKAVKLFELMKQHGYKPNRSTLGSVISAYGQAKFVDKGSHIFSNMKEEYQILPTIDHCTAMVNLYGRSGMLDEALDFIKRMPLEPDFNIWAAFLTACRRHGNVKLAIHAGEQLLELDPENASIQRLVVQLYHLCGISKDSLKIKIPALRKDSTECLGQSWMEDRNTVYTFGPGNSSQLGDESLYSWIKNMTSKTKIPNFSEIPCVQQEENEEIVGVHSEKLALAFALINSCQTSGSVRIVKNSRVCELCHWFAKMVSRTHGLDVYVSDPRCLHHFKDGICSCSDYW